MSEVFVRVHREIETFDTERPVRPWLFAFAVRVASEYRRRAHHRREVFGETIDVAAPAASPEKELERAEARRVVEQGLDALDEDQRAVFVLHELDEIPVPEIARALAIAEGTAYSRLRAARATFTAAIRRRALSERRT